MAKSLDESIIETVVRTKMGLGKCVDDRRAGVGFSLYSELISLGPEGKPDIKEKNIIYKEEAFFLKMIDKGSKIFKFISNS